jgi:lactoylglutathione lyase
MIDNPSSSTNGVERAPASPLLGQALMASLTVRDVQASLAWYRDVVGFAVAEVYAPSGTMLAVSLKAGEVRLLLSQDNGAKGMDRVKGEGFSLQVTTRQNIDEIANRIREHGGALESEPADTPWGARVFRLKDPDGYKLVISSERQY